MANPMSHKPKSERHGVAPISPHLGHWPGGPTPLSVEAMEALVREAHAARSAAVYRAVVALANGPSVLLKAFPRWRRRRTEARELAALDERALRDIGLSRYDALTAAKHDQGRD